LLVNAAGFEKKQQIPILVFDLTNRDSNPQSTVLKLSTLTIITPLIWFCLIVICK
jgi:hypothetical protein